MGLGLNQPGRCFWLPLLTIGLLIFLNGCASASEDITPTIETDLPSCSGVEQDFPLRILALGDSYTIGEGVASDQRWPAHLAANLETSDLTVDPPTYLAQTGWTTGNLLEALTRADLQPPYDIVTLAIGVNNQFQGRSQEEYQAEFEMLVEIAKNLAGNEPARVIVLSIPDYGVMPFAQSRDTEKIAEEIDAFNAINQTISERIGVHYVDVTGYSRRHPDQAASDGLHPSGAQYEGWARLATPAACKALGGDIE